MLSEFISEAIYFRVNFIPNSVVWNVTIKSELIPCDGMYQINKDSKRQIVITSGTGKRK